jgi:hypothetical protein
MMAVVGVAAGAFRETRRNERLDSAARRREGGVMYARNLVKKLRNLSGVPYSTRSPCDQ